MTKMPHILIALIISLTSISGTQASETDQYVSWGHELRDSADTINEYVNQTLLNQLPFVQNEQSCFLATKKLMKPLRHSFQQIIETWAETDPRLDRFPGDTISTKEYWESSILKSSRFHFNIYEFNFPRHFTAIGRTLNVDHIYLGTDKLGHFISFGIRYYEKYLNALENGATEQEAQETAIRFGIVSENTMLGKVVSGVFSFGDLEANYQGFLLMKSICSGDGDIRLTGSEGKWNLEGSFDIRKYVNPYWDESYGTSSYTNKRWKTVQPLLSKYCEKRNDLK